jgi:hypothetical protein
LTVKELVEEWIGFDDPEELRRIVNEWCRK